MEYVHTPHSALRTPHSISLRSSLHPPVGHAMARGLKPAPLLAPGCTFQDAGGQARGGPQREMDSERLERLPVPPVQQPSSRAAGAGRPAVPPCGAAGVLEVGPEGRPQGSTSARKYAVEFLDAAACRRAAMLLSSGALLLPPGVHVIEQDRYRPCWGYLLGGHLLIVHVPCP